MSDNIAVQLHEIIRTYLDANSIYTTTNLVGITDEVFLQRKTFADELRVIADELDKVRAMVGTALQNVSDADRQETSAMSSLLQGKKRQKKHSRQISVGVPRLTFDPIINITPSLAIPVVKTTSLDGVKDDGRLYYVTTLGQFSVKLAGVVFRGNIGNIFTDSLEHTKVRDCKYASTCIKGSTCDFYHDPVLTYGSTDARNYLSNSFSYIGPEHRHNRFIGVKIGSLQNLDSDMISISSEDARKYQDMAMHMLLVAILIGRYQNTSRSL